MTPRHAVKLEHTAIVKLLLRMGARAEQRGERILKPAEHGYHLEVSGAKAPGVLAGPTIVSIHSSIRWERGLPKVASYMCELCFFRSPVGAQGR